MRSWPPPGWRAYWKQGCPDEHGTSKGVSEPFLNSNKRSLSLQDPNSEWEAAHGSLRRDFGEDFSTKNITVGIKGTAKSCSGGQKHNVLFISNIPEFIDHPPGWKKEKLPFLFINVAMDVWLSICSRAPLNRSTQFPYGRIRHFI